MLNFTYALENLGENEMKYSVSIIQNIFLEKLKVVKLIK